MPLEQMKRFRKTVVIPTVQYRRFLRWVESQKTMVEASELSGIPASSLYRIIEFRRASSKNIEKVNEVLNKECEIIK